MSRVGASTTWYGLRFIAHHVYHYLKLGGSSASSPLAYYMHIEAVRFQTLQAARIAAFEITQPELAGVPSLIATGKNNRIYLYMSIKSSGIVSTLILLFAAAAFWSAPISIFIRRWTENVLKSAHNNL